VFFPALVDIPDVLLVLGLLSTGAHVVLKIMGQFIKHWSSCSVENYGSVGKVTVLKVLVHLPVRVWESRLQCWGGCSEAWGWCVSKDVHPVWNW